MKIALAHNAILPSKLYGGTERVVTSLAKGLEELGHQVILISKKSAKQEKLASRHLFVEDGIDFNELNKSVDLLHVHSGIVGIEDFKGPVLYTQHGNIPWGQEVDKNSVFVSKNHAERYGGECYVYNGLDWSRYPEPNLKNKTKYFHFLGKAAWRVKNVQGAIDLINEFKNQRLLVLGGVRFNLNMGIRLTFSPKIRFCGMVDDVQKAKYMQDSKGLIFPVRWHEPFGLAIIESLYFGCPVFGTPYGSLPELVLQGLGYLSSSKEILLQAIQNSDAYNRMDCHEYAKQRFNYQVMAKNYVKVYERVLDGEFLNTKNPRLCQEEKKFLPWE